MLTARFVSAIATGRLAKNAESRRVRAPSAAASCDRDRGRQLSGQVPRGGGATKRRRATPFCDPPPGAGNQRETTCGALRGRARSGHHSTRSALCSVEQPHASRSLNRLALGGAERRRITGLGGRGTSSAYVLHAPRGYLESEGPVRSTSATRGRVRSSSTPAGSDGEYPARGMVEPLEGVGVGHGRAPFRPEAAPACSAAAMVRAALMHLAWDNSSGGLVIRKTSTRR
jgi:hypothetical protein